MSVRRLLIACFAASLPVFAAAQDATTTKFVNLRAGPARDYPLVATLGPGTPLAVQGCTVGYGWCDVIGAGGLRGWVYAGNLAYPYQNSEVPLLGYGATIGLPIITFSIGSYWNDYYRNRPFYRDRDRWSHHRPPPRPVTRPHGPPRPIVRPPSPGPRPPFVRPRPGEAQPPAPRPPVRPPGGA
ncbi:MAG TPA: SH3 domain-containing protein, partial [Caldimonas sp.]|nr:SH3 domain-containing protein [Caldimonas sp.]